MPLSRLQSELLRLLAAQRNPDSYVAGAIPLNRDGPRFSGDIDIFHDSDDRLATTAQADASLIRSAGYGLEWLPSRGAGFYAAVVSGKDDKTQLEWAADTDFRFFPAQPDVLFGYVLHPADLATNKAAAASGRRVPRDIVDLVTIHERILPLGAVIAAAVGRFPGMSPEEMLDEIRRHATFSADEFRGLAMAAPIDARATQRSIRRMLEDAETFIRLLPSEAVGVLFLDEGKPVQPDLNQLGRYARRGGSRRGNWPSSPEIGSEMLKRYCRPEP
ncbi:MAG: hypothetical protein ACREHV_13085 [Rhizomicrobium sp.]